MTFEKDFPSLCGKQHIEDGVGCFFYSEMIEENCLDITTYNKMKEDYEKEIDVHLKDKENLEEEIKKLRVATKRKERTMLKDEMCLDKKRVSDAIDKWAKKCRLDHANYQDTIFIDDEWKEKLEELKKELNLK